MDSFETLPFYRGVSKAYPLDRPSVVRTRKNRTPRDTPIHLHEAADEWFKASFSIGYRSEAVFVTPNIFTARLYGFSPDHCVRVVPMGDYSYCWSSKCSDFLSLVKDGPSVEELTIRLRRVDYGTTNLASAHQSGNELMLCCDAYIAVPIGLLPVDIKPAVSHLIIMT